MKQLTVLSWNIQGNLNRTGYTSFKKVSPVLESTEADILAIQEFNNAEAYIPQIQNFKNLHIFNPNTKQQQKKSSNQNIIISKNPILNAAEVHFPFKNGDRNIDNITRADIEVSNQVLRVYNCQLPLFSTSLALRLKMLEFIIADAKTHKGPTIICGDLNTAIADFWWRKLPIRLLHMFPRGYAEAKGKTIKTCEAEYVAKEIFEPQGFTEALDLHTPTFSPFKTTAWQPFKPKLDWFAVKNLNIISTKLHEYISDHRAIEVTIEI